MISVAEDVLHVPTNREKGDKTVIQRRHFCRWKFEGRSALASGRKNGRDILEWEIRRDTFENRGKLEIRVIRFKIRDTVLFEGWLCFILQKSLAISTSARPRSISAGYAHANTICESLGFRSGPQDRTSPVQAAGNETPWKNEGDVCLVPAEMDHCSGRWFDDHHLRNKTIETPRSTDLGIGSCM
ncbi:hypothetical protein KM043_006898 [Ampulex compressa]|nr:hypothetical protein KM043_006898 [Ampulex compressa]